MPFKIVVVLILLGTTSLVVAEETSTKKYDALLAEYEKEGGARAFASRFLEFATENRDDPISVDALFWVLKYVRGRSETTQAIEELQRHHVGSAKMASGCKLIAESRTTAAQSLLRTTIDKNKSDAVRAQACYYLALLLDREATIVSQLKSDPQLAPRVLQYYGKEYGEHLSSIDADKLERHREQVYQQLRTSFADVEVAETTMGEIAERALFALRHLSIGKVAPDINGEDIDGVTFKLSDYRGKIVMLSFWGHW